MTSGRANTEWLAVIIAPDNKPMPWTLKPTAAQAKEEAGLTDIWAYAMQNGYRMGWQLEDGTRYRASVHRTQVDAPLNCAAGATER